MSTPTPTQEDYLKAMWMLIHRKGYARVSDVAEVLSVSQASVSRMVRRLHEDGLTIYEPYRGLNLTPAGRQRGRMLVERQRVLRQWLEAMGMPPGEQFERTVEGIEHHFGSDALARVEHLVHYIAAHPVWWGAYLDDAGGGAHPHRPSGDPPGSEPQGP